jgi:hypothetical protein
MEISYQATGIGHTIAVSERCEFQRRLTWAIGDVSCLVQSPCQAFPLMFAQMDVSKFSRQKVFATVNSLDVAHL